MGGGNSGRHVSGWLKRDLAGGDERERIGMKGRLKGEERSKK